MRTQLGASLVIKYFVLGILLCVGLFMAAKADWAGLFLVTQTILFSLIPTFLRRVYGIHTPHLLQAGVAIFMFATIFLGESGGFYDRFWWWDLLWHTFAGLVFGLVAYVILILTYRKQNVVLAPVFTAVFAVSFSLCASTLWEMLEFAADFILGTNMQNSAADTMTDLIVGFIGALISAQSGYRYLQHNDRFGINRIIDDGVSGNQH